MVDRGNTMKKIKEYFKDYSGQEKVVRFFIETGLSVKDNGVYCNGVKMSPSRIGRFLDIDRRTVVATVETIEGTPELRGIFKHLRATAFFKDIASDIDAGLIEIIPTDPHATGILTGVAKIIADLDISIRQSITEDPEFKEEAKLFVITESSVPMDAVKDIMKVEGVLSVTIY